MMPEPCNPPLLTIVARKRNVVRDTFSMPPAEYQMIEEIRIKVAKEGYIYSKSEVIRAGLIALESMAPHEMVYRLRAVQKVKPGRKV